METFIAVAVGLGLAAAAGMRVFLPLFALGLAGASGLVPIADGWIWLTSPAALIGLGTAMILEVAAYYVPWLDSALDTIATPAALIAGMVATASVLIDVPPMLKWAVVIVGGGGVAGLTQGASVAARLTSGVMSGGVTNPVVSTTELIGAILLALLAILAPLLGLIAVIVLLVWVVRRAGRVLFGRRRVERPATS